MHRHLLKCAAAEDSPSLRRGRVARDTDHLLIFVDGKPYWLYVAASPAATLGDLDDLLRRVWLECCGHLSQFIICDRRFVSYEDDDGDDMWDRAKSMADVRIADAVAGVGEFWHEYDFGSTTRLRLMTLGPIAAAMPAGDAQRPTRSRRARRDNVTILARNLSPALRCHECGEPATQICPVCCEPGTVILCDSCGEDHADEHDGEDVLLPLVNSPRTGVCAYCGQDE